jgi:ribosome-binding factor A
MREELSELIRYESSDPRLAEVDVTQVILSTDAKRADVLVSLPAEEDRRKAALDGLTHAKAYLRRQLMQRMDLYRFPELRFVPASETGSGSPLTRLLRRARRGRITEEDKPSSNE